jgi:hypothetical protein
MKKGERKIITDKSISIAEFMGCTIYGDKRNIVTPKGSKYKFPKPIENRATYGNDLRYHTSWDWLMPVVEKIESIENELGYLYSVTIMNKNQCEITNENEYICGGGFENLETTKIEAVYEAVVGFIKLYNEKG